MSVVRQPTTDSAASRGRAVSAPTEQTGSSNQSQSPASFESFLQERIQTAQTSLWRAELTRRALLGIIACQIVVLIWLVLDQWVWSPGVWGRSLIALALSTVGIIYVLKYLLPVLRQHVRADYAARALERDHPELGHSLSSYITLRDQRNAYPDGQLAVRVVQSVGATAATKLKSIDAVPSEATGLMRWWIAVIGLMALMAIYSIASPKNSLQSVARLAAPMASLEAPRRVSITDVVPGDTEVLAGRSFSVAATVTGLRESEKVRFRWQATTATAEPNTPTTNTEESNSDREMSSNRDSNDSRFQTSVPVTHHASGTRDYFVVAGDAIAGPFEVTIRDTPVVSVSEVHYQPPAYTGESDRIRRSGAIRGVDGTRVTLHAIANRPVQRAVLEFNPRQVGQEIQATAGAVELTIGSDGQKLQLEFPLRARGGAVAGVELENYRIRIWDDAGQSNVDPIIYPIEVIEDLPPEITIVLPRQTPKDVPLNAQQLFEIHAADVDYGLAEVELEIRRGIDLIARKSLWKDPKGQPGNQVLEYRFSPSRMIVAGRGKAGRHTGGLNIGDEVEVVAIATDNRTDAKDASITAGVTRTAPIRLRIVAPNENETQPGDGEPGDQTQDGQSKSKSEKEGQEGQSGQQGEAGGEGQSGGGESGEGQQGEGQQGEGQQGQGKQGEGQQGDGQQGDSQQGEGQSEASGQSGEGQSKQDGQAGEQEQSGQQTGSENQGSGSQDPGSMKPPSGENSAASQDGASENAGQQPNENKGNPSDSAGQSSSSEQASESGNPTQNGSQASNANRTPDANQSQSGDSSNGSGQPDAPPQDDAEAFERIRDYLEKQKEKANKSGQPNDGDSSQGGDNAGESKQPEDAGSEQGPSSTGEQPSDAGNDAMKKANADETSPGSEGDSGSQKEPGSQGDQSSQSPSDDGTKSDSNNDAGSGKSGDRESPDNPNGKQSPDKQPPEKGDNSTGEDAGSEDGQSAKDDADAGSEGMDSSEDGTGNQGPDEGAQDNQDGGKPEQGGSESPNKSTQPEGTSGSEGEGSDGQESESQGDQSQETLGEGKGGQPEGKQGDAPESSGDPTGKESNTGDGKTDDGSPSGEPSSKSSNDMPPSSNQADSDDQRTSEDSGDQGSTQGGGTGSSGSGVGEETGQEAPLPDPVDLDYTKKATDLVLDYLDQTRQSPDQRMLDDLKWTEEDLRRFRQRWQNVKPIDQGNDATPNGDAEAIEEALRSLGMRPPNSRSDKQTDAADRVRGLRDAGNRRAAPPSVRDAFEAFRRGLSRP